MGATRGNNLLLEPLLQALWDGESDPAAAIAAVRKLLSEQPSLVSRDTLFKDARRRWADQKDPNVSTDRFALLVIACGWEELLEQFLLQNHAADALADMQSLLRVSERLSVSSASPLMPPLLDALLTVALLFIFGYEQSDDTARHTRFLEDIAPSPFDCSCVRFPSATSTLSQHIKQQNESSDDAWKDFFELPIALDDRKFNSKSGRALGAALLQVTEQQDHILALAHGRCGNDPNHLGSQHDDESRVVLEQLWEVAHEVLKVGSAASTTEGCVECISKTSSGNAKSPSETHDQVTIIFDDASLESYLTQKAAPDSHAVSKSREVIPASCHENQQAGDLKDSGMRHFTQLLSELHCEPSLTKETQIAEVVPTAQEELLTLTDLNVLGIQVSYLLAAQLRSNKRISETDSKTHRRCTRQVLRVFNSLTDGSDVQQQHRISELVMLAGFCPSEIIQEILHRSMVTPQYNHMYTQVFQVCPILLEWRQEGNNESLVILELRKIFKEMIAAPNLFESQSRNFVELLRAFTRAPKSTTGRAGGAAVIQVQHLIQDVMIPVHQMLLEDEKEVAKYYFRMLREFIGCCVSDSRWARSASGTSALKALLELLTSAYARELKVDSPSSLPLTNTLLLSIKDLVILARSLSESSVFDAISSILVDWDELDDPLLMLLAHAVPTHDVSLSRRELHPLRLLSKSLDKSATAEKAVNLDVDSTSEALRLLLWKLLWESVCSEAGENSIASSQQSQPLITKARAWELLEFVAEQSFEDAVDDNESSSMAGSILIQREMTQVMLRCGPLLFSALYTEVLPKLAKYDTLLLQFPDERLRQFESNDDEASSLSTSLRTFQPSHAIMKYVIECWTSQVISGGRSDGSQDNLAAFLEMARHVLVSIDNAVSTSTSSLFELLYCFQWVCYTIWIIDTSYLREFESSHSTRNQLEIAVLRLLYLLDQVQVATQECAKFSRRFVASWTAYLPHKSYEQVCNFVSSAKRDL
ncbi:hypothetical protein FI667_g14091, partial [Globisporangium splendens]